MRNAQRGGRRYPAIVTHGASRRPGRTRPERQPEDRKHRLLKIRASIYATARLAFEAWTEPAVAHSAALDPRDFYWSDEFPDHCPRYVDLEWLMAGDDGRANTLYLAAPATEFDRLAPVLGGLLGDLR